MRWPKLESERGECSDVLVLLDSGPLGLLSNPTTAGPAHDARHWASARLRAGDQLFVPEKVATTNTKHLERYVDARLWSDL